MADVIDELIVRLTLDAEQYRAAQQRIDELDTTTYRRARERARRTDREQRNQQRRLGDVAGTVRAFSRQVTLAVGVVSGLGIAALGVANSFLNFETNLRRQTVGTALSNRQMQAWAATAKRLGADADAGAEAVAALARETQQGVFSGQAPIMAALSQIGVTIGDDMDVQTLLAQAQRRFAEASPEQRRQYENVLSAQGVSPDLILMLKSEKDLREQYAKSYGQSVEENRVQLDKLADAMATVRAAGLSAAGTLTTALIPMIERGSIKLGEWATDLASFVNQVNAAGGGVDGFRIALEDNSPKLSHMFEGFILLGDVLAGIWPMMQNFGDWLGKMGGRIREQVNRVRNPFGSDGLADALDRQSQRAHQWLFGRDGENGAANRAALAFDDWLRRASSRPGNTHATNPALPRNIENDVPTGRAATVPANGQAIMAALTGTYGLNTAQAAAVLANLQRESGLNPAAYNGKGGGTGARGLAQWRGARSEAFKRRYGVMPDRGTVAQQLEFMMTDAYERQLLNRALRAGGGTAAGMGESVSRIYEAHGNVAEDRNRGLLAARFAGSPASGPTVNIQNLTVQSNDAPGLVQGLQRLPETQAYNTVIR